MRRSKKRLFRRKARLEMRGDRRSGSAVVVFPEGSEIILTRWDGVPEGVDVAVIDLHLEQGPYPVSSYTGVEVRFLAPPQLPQEGP